jgi:DNA-binding Lrp family transcriptional regulator
MSNNAEQLTSDINETGVDWKTEVDRAIKINIEQGQKILKRVNETIRLINEVESKPTKMGKLEKAEAQLNADVASLAWLNSLTRNDLLKLKRDISEVISLSENLDLSSRYYRAVKEQTIGLLTSLQKKGQ